MKRARLVWVLVVGVLALSIAALAGVASGAMTLPELSTATNATSIGGAGSLLGLATIQCTGNTGSTTAEGKKHGKYTVTFTGCSLGGQECKSLGGVAKTVTVSGLALLVLTLKPSDIRLVLFEQPRTHIECAFLSTLVLVEGTVLGSIELEAGTKNKFKLKVKATSSTAPEFKTYEDGAGTAVTVSLKCSTNEGTVFDECTENAGEATSTTTAAADSLIN